MELCIIIKYQVVSLADLKYAHAKIAKKKFQKIYYN